MIKSVGRHHKINGAVGVRELGMTVILGYVSTICSKKNLESSKRDMPSGVQNTEQHTKSANEKKINAQ